MLIYLNDQQDTSISERIKICIKIKMLVITFLLFLSVQYLLKHTHVLDFSEFHRVFNVQ